MALSPEGTIVRDIRTGAQWEEEDGRIKQIDRMMLVSDIDMGNEIPSARDWRLQKVLDSPNVPQPGDAHPLAADLFLRGRVVRPVDTNIFELLLTYKLPEGGTLPDPNNYELSGGASIQQIPTEIDRNGDQITVEYEGVEQGGTITPYEAIAGVTFEYVATNVAPLAVVRLYTNLVNNSVAWFHDPSALARTWIIADVAFDRIQVVPITKYRFGFTLQHNPDGWDPQVIYEDPETGRPPPDLVAGVGYKTIPWHNEVNFNEVLP
jgi:hypothetical protein